MRVVQSRWVDNTGAVREGDRHAGQNISGAEISAPCVPAHLQYVVESSWIYFTSPAGKAAPIHRHEPAAA
jgi:hypothetical protein